MPSVLGRKVSVKNAILMFVCEFESNESNTPLMSRCFSTSQCDLALNLDSSGLVGAFENDGLFILEQ